MKKIMTSLVAVALTAGIGSTVKAGDYGWGGGEWEDGHYAKAKGYALKFGVKFDYGYFYPGKVHKHWTESWYDEYYKTTMFFDLYRHTPYYYCPGHDRYYPVCYIDEVGPDAPPLKGGKVGGPAPVGGGAAPGGAAPAPGGAAPAPGGAAPAPGGAKPADGKPVVDDIPEATGPAPKAAAPKVAIADPKPEAKQVAVKKMPATPDDDIPE